MKLKLVKDLLLRRYKIRFVNGFILPNAWLLLRGLHGELSKMEIFAGTMVVPFGVSIGPVLNGKAHWQWRVRHVGGVMMVGDYVNGKEHGQWTLKIDDKLVGIGPMANGKMHGQWKIKYPYGDSTETYVDGKLHGQWETRFFDDTVITAQCADGKLHGQLDVRYANGSISTYEFVDDKLHGQAEARNANGTVVNTVKYVNGEMQP